MAKYVFLYITETTSEYALRCLGFHEGRSKEQALGNLLDVLEKQNYYERVNQWDSAQRRFAYQIDGEWEVNEYGNEVAQQRV